MAAGSERVITTLEDSTRGWAEIERRIRAGEWRD